MGTFDAIADFVGRAILVIGIYGLVIACVVLWVMTLFENRRLYGRWLG